MQIIEQRQLLQEALALATHGWRLTPLHYVTTVGDNASCSCRLKSLCGKSAGKHPMANKWEQAASANVDAVRAWWSDHRYANIGVVCGEGSGIICLDIDPENGGEETLTALEAENAPLPTTVESRTGSLGRHLIFKHPGFGFRIGNSQSDRNRKKLGPGLDVRGDGGQFVAPPSIHRSGRRYEWIRAPGTVPIASLPDWMLLRLVKSSEDPNDKSEPGTQAPSDFRLPGLGGKNRRRLEKYAIAALAEECERIAHAGKGEWNKQLNESSFRLGTLAGAGVIDESTVREAFVASSDVRGHVGPEVAATFRSGFEAGFKRPRDLGSIVDSDQQIDHSLNGQPLTGAGPIATPVETSATDQPEPSDAAPASHPQAAPVEAHDSPHRLARLYLATLSQDQREIIRFLDEEWRQWDARRFATLHDNRIRSEINSFLHRTFTTDWRNGFGEIAGHGDDKERVVSKVHTGVVTNTIEAASGIICKGTIEESFQWK